MTVKLLTITLMFLTFAARAAGNVRPENPVVLVETSMGNFKVELLEDKAPITVKNFLAYADEKFYDGTVFHRILGKPANTKDFMIQGGGFEPGGKQKKTKDPIKNEANNGLSNTRGTLAMARTGIVDSATSQFFINLADNTFPWTAPPRSSSSTSPTTPSSTTPGPTRGGSATACSAE
jgi:cyclophilin family peptidyl-prolyl cis-trans isomerase